jgi:hypothetical protein
MNKSIEAALRGYVLFAVNGQRFMTYNAALKARKFLTDETGHPFVRFMGFHLFKGWVCFYLRMPLITQMSCERAHMPCERAE